MNSKKIIILLKKNDINFVTGVPDSVLKPLIEGIDKDKYFKHVFQTTKVRLFL